MLFGSGVFQLGDDLGDDVVCLSEIPERAEREQGTRVQNEIFADGLGI